MLRLQDYQGYRESFDSVFGDRFVRLLCVKHLGKSRENPHYHFVFRTDYKDSALRKYLKSQFTQGKGNGHMSLKPWDGQDEALSYMFHEGTEPVMNKGYTQDEINGYKEKDLTIRESHVKPGDVCGVMVEKLKAKHPRYSDQIDRKNIFTELYKYYKAKGDWLPNRYQMERYINKVRMILTPDVKDQLMINIIYNEWFRD